MCSTGVTVSFLRAELYCSSERRGSPLGKVRSGDLVAISHTPSYHSSGQSPERTKHISIDVNRLFLIFLIINICEQPLQVCFGYIWINIDTRKHVSLSHLISLYHTDKLFLFPLLIRNKTPWKGTSTTLSQQLLETLLSQGKQTGPMTYKWRKWAPWCSETQNK